MTEPIHEALKHHTKEPEEVDYEHLFHMAIETCDYWSRQFCKSQQENDRLKDTILRLEQKCAKLETT